MDADLRTSSGPAIEHQGALASILMNLDAGGVFFVDEIHRLARPVEESLYPAMEDFKFDWVSGKGAGAQSLRLNLPQFTVIGATTRQGMLSGPLRDRFGAVFRLEFYEPEDIRQIVLRSARILEVDVDDAAARLLASRSRGTPRIANRLLRRVRDWAQVKGSGRIDAEAVGATMDLLSVDGAGLGPARPAHPLHPDREVRRRPGRRRHPGGVDLRGAGDGGGRVRAVPDPAGLPGADPAGPGRHPAGLPAPGPYGAGPERPARPLRAA